MVVMDSERILLFYRTSCMNNHFAAYRLSQVILQKVTQIAVVLHKFIVLSVYSTKITFLTEIQEKSHVTDARS